MKNIEFSVVVTTYNFEKIILECLEGIEKQTYKNFEVIIADDASKDKTIEICEEWRDKVKGIISVKIIRNEKNEGVTKNANKGVKLATKEWIKVLAGDDILKKTALEDFKNFIEKNLEAKVIFAKAQQFYNQNNKKIYTKIIPEKIDIYNRNIKKQLKELLDNNFIVAPTAIIKKELLKEMNYFDEKYKMVEDYPFWIKLLKNNIKFYFLDKVVVEYRKSPSSVSGKKKEARVNPVILEFEKQIYKDIYLKEIKNPLRLWDKYINIKRKEIILKNNNRSSILTQMLRYLQVKKLKKILLKIMIFFFFYFLIKYVKIKI